MRVAEHYGQFINSFEFDLEFEQTPWFKFESSRDYWDEQHLERGIQGDWETTCSLAAHGDVHSMSYRESAWENVDGRWRLRPHILEAGQQLVEPATLIAEVEFLHETHVWAAIEAGRLPAHGSGTWADPWTISCVELAAAIRRYGMRIE